MSETTKVACYRDRDNGVYFQRQQHRHDCADGDCRGCALCAEASHCTASKNCTWHVNEGELTCGRCIGAARRDLRWIGDLAPLMMTAAMASGVNSEAANLAGPAADYGVFSARRQIDKQWIFEHLPPTQTERAIRNLIPDDDEHHPYAVTTRWEAMLREDYGHEATAPASTAGAVAYLERNLHRVANDEEQDFPLMARELRKCRQHLESVLQNDSRPERGVPCPDCTNQETGVGPRLVRLYPHWCEDAACERMHYADATEDVWQCPRVKEHQWTNRAYNDRLAERKKSA